MTTRIMHFTLGPVQGFIADARRTRDLWAGSFLLSWLSGQAMAALKAAGGDIVFPQVDDDALFKAIKGHGGTPYIGSLPNRFKADISKVQGDAGAICRQAVLDSWEALHSKVWKNFIVSVAAQGNDTQGIWSRQVDNFWEINWVTGDADENDGQWLDLRKNWRTALPPDEPGDKCRLMGRYQELSGHPRIGSGVKQKDFWKKLAAVHDISALDLKEDERLCAIALIKRLFPLIAQDVIGWTPGGEKIDIRHWPSVSYVAAVPWLKAAKVIPAKAHGDYWANADAHIDKGHMGEFHTKLFGLPGQGFFKLDGHLLHQDGIKAWPDDGLNVDAATARTALLDGLKDVQKRVGGSASEFYAVLMMDGDKVGARIKGQAADISDGLAEFSKSVKDYFDPTESAHNPADGVLIYAGGDDVLALVPVDSAIDAALALRNKYQSAFVGAAGDAFTLSAAIVIAQYKIPLRAVLEQAHHYLDDIAKDENGRNSLAIAIMKPGGIASDWVVKWGPKTIPILQEVAKSKGEYSASFFYNFRERYAPLFDTGHRVSERETGELLTEDMALVRALITAEYKKQFNKEALKNRNIDAAVDKMMAIGTAGAGDSYDFDAALVARFLSVEGKWDLLPLKPASKEGV